MENNQKNKLSLKKKTPQAPAKENTISEIEKKAREEAKESLQKAIAYLCKKFPNSFFEDKDAKKPFKIGVINEIFAIVDEDRQNNPDFDPVLTKTKIREAVKYYTNDVKYLESVKAGVKRINLEGVELEDDVVTEGHEEYAKERIEKFKAKMAEKNAKKKAVAKKKPSFNKNGPKKFGDKKPMGLKRKSFVQNSDSKKNESVKFEQIDAADIVVGANVHVLLGNRLMSAVIKDVTKDAVSVQFKTGIVAKVTPNRVGK